MIIAELRHWPILRNGVIVKNTPTGGLSPFSAWERNRFSRGRGRVLAPWCSLCSSDGTVHVLSGCTLRDWPPRLGYWSQRRRWRHATRRLPTPLPTSSLHKANLQRAHATHYSPQNLTDQCALATESFEIAFCSLCGRLKKFRYIFIA